MKVFLLPRIGHSTLVTTHMDMVPAVLCKLSAAVNPLIYGLLWVNWSLWKEYEHRKIYYCGYIAQKNPQLQWTDDKNILA